MGVPHLKAINHARHFLKFISCIEPSGALPMVLERKLLMEDISDDLSPVMVRILNEIRDALQELRGSMPDSILVSLAESKLAMIERRAGEGLGSGHEHVSPARSG